MEGATTDELRTQTIEQTPSALIRSGAKRAVLNGSFDTDAGAMPPPPHTRMFFVQRELRPNPTNLIISIQTVESLV